MAHKINRLSDRKVRAASAKGLYPDGAGLLLQVSGSGSKSWILRYKRAGKARDMGLGSFRDVSLAEARDLALEARQKLKAGIDPIEARKAQASEERLTETRAKTFRQAAQEYIATHEPGWRNKKHRLQWRRTLETYAYPLIGDLPVAKIGTQDVRAVLDPIWAAKPETASRVRARIETVINAGRADDDSQWSNPARWERHKHKFLKRGDIAPTRHHPALKYQELPGFMERLRQRGNITSSALEFLILTAVRSGEVRGARWDEVDFEARLWVIPPERMKAGEEHRVPLSDRALAILHDLAAVRLGELIFPGVRRHKPLHDNTLRMALRTLEKGITCHGFRSAFRDWAAEQTNTQSFVAEAALAHAIPDRVEAAYRRTDLLERRRELMQAWAQFCEPAPNWQKPDLLQPTVKARKIAHASASAK